MKKRPLALQLTVNNGRSETLRGFGVSNKMCSWRLSRGRKELDCSCCCSWHLCLDPQYPLDVIMGWLHIPGTFGLIWMIKENEMYVPDTCQLAIIIACIYIMYFSMNLKAPCLWKSIFDWEEEIISILHCLGAMVRCKHLVILITICIPNFAAY